MIIAMSVSDHTALKLKEIPLMYVYIICIDIQRVSNSLFLI